jgi:hypothetical protein
MTTTKVQAYAAQSATSALAPLGIARREPGPLNRKTNDRAFGQIH